MPSECEQAWVKKNGADCVWEISTYPLNSYPLFNTDGYILPARLLLNYSAQIRQGLTPLQALERNFAGTLEELHLLYTVCLVKMHEAKWPTCNGSCLLQNRQLTKK